MPSLPGTKFTKQPKSMIFTTFPTYTSPTSMSLVMRRIASSAPSDASRELDPITTSPSSPMSMCTPCSSCKALTVAPPGPISIPILSFGISTFVIRGASSRKSSRDSGMVIDM